MDLQNYTLKTDREKQWNSLETFMKEHGATRKNLHACRKFFFEGVDISGNFRITDKFTLYPYPCFEGWQKLFEEELVEPVSDQDFRTLNHYLCGQLADDFFCIEDQDYYFKIAFGEFYDRERKFPLKVNNEAECRTIVLTENAIFLSLVNRFSRWLKAKQNKEQGVLRFNHKYFESLLPIIEKTPFSDVADLPMETSDGSARPSIARAGIKTILKFGTMSSRNESENERIASAQRVTEILMDHANDLADLRNFYGRAKKEARNA